MSELLRRLREYADSDNLPMHMPGHKRRMGEPGDPFFDGISKIDITEIKGFDNLHHAEGILLRAQERAADLYHSEETRYLVNGSTSGILAAVSGCTSFGGRILMARNSHKSAYHAVLLRGLQAEYIYPQSTGDMGINGPVLADDVEKILHRHTDIQAVLITSPTYDGVVSDVREIARIAHRYGIPLIVDEAHGAHFPFSAHFPEDSVCCGADVVVHSLHKTLPALTQSALIHLNGNYIDRERIRYYLTVYQSSSPSYVLMAGLDVCVGWISGHREAFDRFWEELCALRSGLEGMERLRLLGSGELCMDSSRISVSVRGTGITGRELDRRLRDQYHIELEMACVSYVCAITSVADTGENLKRLRNAFLRIDDSLRCAEGETSYKESGEDTALLAESVCTILQAEERPWEYCTPEDSPGRVSRDFITLYPPGIPILVPGERITGPIAERIRRYMEDGLEVHGVSHGKIRVFERER